MPAAGALIALMLALPFAVWLALLLGECVFPPIHDLFSDTARYAEDAATRWALNQEIA